MLRIFLAAVGVLLLSAGAYAQAPVEATVVPFELNVRAAPSTRSALLGVFDQGASISVTGREDEPGNGGVWVYATNGTLSGWVLSDYVRFIRGSIGSLPVIAGGGESSPAPVNDPAPAAPAPTGGLNGTTTTILNFRAGPAITFPVIETLPAGTRVTVAGRNEAGTWLSLYVNGKTGWVAQQYIRLSGSVEALPVAGLGSEENAAPPPATSQNWDIVSGIDGYTREIFLIGQQKGNRRDVFSKVGDSITASPLFLTPIGHGGLDLANYPHLQGVVDFYKRTIARTHNSFANRSLAALHGWTSSDLLNPARNISPVCGGMTPLVCEYTLTKPAVALIMIGTNDAGHGINPDTYRANLQTIVQTSIDMGVIPVLSTLPNHKDAQGRVDQLNSIIISTAQAYRVPLWRYGEVMSGLPNAGLAEDGIHPSSGSSETGVFADSELKYGYNIRNLTALMVLDILWRNVLS